MEVPATRPPVVHRMYPKLRGAGFLGGDPAWPSASVSPMGEATSGSPERPRAMTRASDSRRAVAGEALLQRSADPPPADAPLAQERSCPPRSTESGSLETAPVEPSPVEPAPAEQRFAEPRFAGRGASTASPTRVGWAEGSGSRPGVGLGLLPWQDLVGVLSGHPGGQLDLPGEGVGPSAQEFVGVHGRGDSGAELTWFSRATAAELARLPGWTPEGAARVWAAFELGRRAERCRVGPGTRIDGAASAASALAPLLRGERTECLAVALLDARHRLLSSRLIGRGTLDRSLVHPREVFAPALREGAGAILCAHNHPSGDPEPSGQDWAVTRRLVAAGELLGVPLLDHLVIGAGCWVSLRARDPGGLFASRDGSPSAGAQAGTEASPSLPDEG